MTSSEKLKYHKTPFVLQFHVPKRKIHPEEHAHHFLFIYLPFRNENELNYGNSPSYTEQVGTLGIINIINKNRSHVSHSLTLLKMHLKDVMKILI